MDDSALVGVIEGLGGLDAQPGHGAEELAALEFRAALETAFQPAAFPPAVAVPLCRCVGG